MVTFSLRLCLYVLLLGFTSCSMYLSPESLLAPSELEIGKAIQFAPEENVFPEYASGSTFFTETVILPNGSVINSPIRVYYKFDSSSEYYSMGSDSSAYVVKTVEWYDEEFYPKTGPYRYSIEIPEKSGKKKSYMYLIKRHVGNGQITKEILVKVTN